MKLVQDEQAEQEVPKFTPEQEQALEKIRENITRLQQLHTKLHSLLQELNSIDKDKL